MGLGTCLSQQKWWPQLKTTTLAVYSQSKDVGVPSYDTEVRHLFLAHTRTRNATLKMCSNNMEHWMVNNQTGQVLLNGFVDLSTKLATSTQSNEVGSICHRLDFGSSLFAKTY